MTKGHFHTDLMTAEIYYTLSGTGYMMLENKEGDWRALPLAAGQAVYVPRGYAHRTINSGNDPLIVFLRLMQTQDTIMAQSKRVAIVISF